MQSTATLLCNVPHLELTRFKLEWSEPWEGKESVEYPSYLVRGNIDLAVRVEWGMVEWCGMGRVGDAVVKIRSNRGNYN